MEIRFVTFANNLLTDILKEIQNIRLVASSKAVYSELRTLHIAGPHAISGKINNF
jgi:hypothetical protein